MTADSFPVTRKKLYIVRIWIKKEKNTPPVWDFFPFFLDPAGSFRAVSGDGD
jgi:hypothetical protein